MPFTITRIKLFRLVREVKAESTMMKELPRLVPFVRPELPRLARRHHTYNPIPGVSAEFLQRFHTVNDKVSRLRLCFFPAGVNGCTFPVDRDHVFRAGVAFSSSTRTSFLRGLESGFLEELFDVMHSNEGGGRG